MSHNNNNQIRRKISDYTLSFIIKAWTYSLLTRTPSTTYSLGDKYVSLLSYNSSSPSAVAVAAAFDINGQFPSVSKERFLSILCMG